MTGKKLFALLLPLLLLTGCMSESNFDLFLKTKDEERKYSFSCDRGDEIASCKKAEAILKGQPRLKGSSLRLSGCPASKADGPLVEIKGRLKGRDIEAFFFKTSECQKRRWQKIVPLLESLD